MMAPGGRKVEAVLMIDAVETGERGDKELIDAFYQNGDDVAFQQIIDRWRGPLVRYFRRLDPRSPEDDLCQETLIRVFLTRETLQSRYDKRRGAKFSTWLYCIAHRIFLDWRRRREREPVLADLPDPDEAAGEKEPGSPDPDIEELPGRLALDRCIQQLPEQQRSYICLCGEHGLGELSHMEIAEVLGVGPSRVTAIHKAALAGLRSSLERENWHG
jgi:RNA polymerase sigma factor (sigma-70 family)